MSFWSRSRKTKNSIAGVSSPECGPLVASGSPRKRRLVCGLVAVVRDDSPSPFVDSLGLLVVIERHSRWRNQGADHRSKDERSPFGYLEDSNPLVFPRGIGGFSWPEVVGLLGGRGTWRSGSEFGGKRVSRLGLDRYETVSPKRKNVFRLYGLAK